LARYGEKRQTRGTKMSRSSLYLVIGILAALVIALAIYFFYQETQEPALEVRVDEQGISVDTNG
jgi:hypothetical protein